MHAIRNRWIQAGLSALTIFVGAICSGQASAVATTVYKCFDKNLAVLYTDEPCAGELLSIKAGEADPVAVAELQRERDALSRSTAARLADYRRAALEQALSPPWFYQPGEDRSAYREGAVFAPNGYGFLPSTPYKRPHSTGKLAVHERRTVSNPPHITLPKN